MAALVVWMDLDEAKIFTIVPGQARNRILRRVEIRHHTGADPENHKKTQTYFSDLAERLEGAEEILLMGPSFTKDHFKTYLELRHAQTLANKVVGTIKVDHPTDNQILAKSREFFRIHDLYA